MAFINHEQKILVGKIIQQRIRRIAWFSTIKISAVIFNPTAHAHFFEHFNVVFCTLFNALCFQKLIVFIEKSHLLFQVLLNGIQCFIPAQNRRLIVGRRVHPFVRHCANGVPCLYRKLTDFFNLIAKELYTHAIFKVACRDDFHHIPTHSKIPTRKANVVSCVLNLNELFDQFFPVHLHIFAQRNHVPFIFNRVTHGVNTADRGNNNHVFSFS